MKSKQTLIQCPIRKEYIKIKTLFSQNPLFTTKFKKATLYQEIHLKEKQKPYQLKIPTNEYKTVLKTDFIVTLIWCYIYRNKLNIYESIS